VRGLLDVIAGRYPRFVFGGRVGRVLPVFHFHETTRDRLEPRFAYLAENGYRTIVSEDVARFVRDGADVDPRAVMLAFDDAWASLWLVVGPLLRKYGLRAVTYAIPARIIDAPAVRPTIDEAAVDAEAADRARDPFATWPELKALADSGLVDVQSHTWSHSMIFTGDVVVGRVTAAFAGEPILNRPRSDPPGGPLEFVTPDRTGYPLFQRRSRMSDGLRFFPDPVASAALESSSDRSDAMLPFAGALKGRWETPAERQRAIEEELVNGREALERRLGTRVRHLCLPWGVMGAIARRSVERTGFLTAFANRFSGRFAVAQGDDPYFLKRLSERYLTSLPGRGRRTFAAFG